MEFLNKKRTGEANMKQGIFMDGSISGIRYETAHEVGVLDSRGHFTYEEGDSITFSGV